MDDEAVNYLMKNFNVDELINGIIGRVYSMGNDELSAAVWMY